jgi:translation initiation factor 1
VRRSTLAGSRKSGGPSRGYSHTSKRNQLARRSSGLVEICKVCGLPKELCICGTLAKEAAKIKVYTVKRSYGKSVTVIEGVAEGAKELAKKLKSKLAAGGTIKGGRIEVQGDHAKKVKQILLQSGFKEEQIEVAG